MKQWIFPFVSTVQWVLRFCNATYQVSSQHTTISVINHTQKTIQLFAIDRWLGCLLIKIRSTGRKHNKLLIANNNNNCLRTQCIENFKTNRFFLFFSIFVVNLVKTIQNQVEREAIEKKMFAAFFLNFR